MASSIRLGTIKGITVTVHWTFFLLLAWIVGKTLMDGGGTHLALFELGFVLTVFACVVLHEFGHALTALRFGVQTRDITLLPIGGVARLERMPEKPIQEFLVAIGGPAVNIIILIVLVPLLLVLDLFPLQTTPERVSWSDFFSQLVLVNMMLVVFNLIPAFPMDGGRVLRSLLAIRMGRERATRIAALTGQVFAVGFVLAGLAYNPMLVLIGVFVFFGAQAELRSVLEDAAFKKQSVGLLTMRQFDSVRPDDALSVAANHLLAGYATDFLVLQQGLPVGVLTRDQLLRAFADRDKQPLNVGEVMQANPPILDTRQPLDQAWLMMREGAWPLLPVYENGLLYGILTSDNLSDYFALKMTSAR
ncbi:MAG: site-2 protease family protein [Bacteroidota bacterium]